MSIVERQSLLTVAEAATILRLSRKTAYKLVNTGDLPAVRIGGSLRIRRVDLDRLLEQPADNGDERSGVTTIQPRAVSRLAERHVRHQRDPIAVTELVRTLEALDVDRDRANAGIRLAVDSGRLIATPNGLAIPTFRAPEAA